MDLARLTATDFRDNPVLFVELAREWAAGGNKPSKQHEAFLKELPRPLITKPAAAREAFWGVLSFPQRGRALTWLNRMGMLAEILPVWNSIGEQQSLRLQAVEEVHLERWAKGLNETSYDWLCVYQDQRVDGRLGGWALTSFATLLLSNNEESESYAEKVGKDLKVLGASAGERERVTVAVLEYPVVFEAIRSDKPLQRGISPTAIVAALATIMAMPEADDGMRQRAIQLGNQLLLRFAAPETTPARRKSKERS
ncbi:hypothetical protein EHM69_05820 [candidate division KSB1 bacterium]|nr:MAG: hypothetical protein EHM69_05820 [candidate division KSB1 bacterium]